MMSTRVNEIETQALENVNLEVEKGEFVSVMGPSGCGKSTLLNIIGLLDSDERNAGAERECDHPCHGQPPAGGGPGDRTLGFVFPVTPV